MEPLIKKVEILNGEPVFRGTDIPIQDLRDHLATGKPLDDFLAQHPQLTRTQINQALETPYPRQSPTSTRKSPLTLFAGNLLLWLAPILFIAACVSRPGFPFILAAHATLWPGYVLAAIGDCRAGSRFSTVRLAWVLIFGLFLGITGPVFASADVAANLRKIAHQS